MAILQLLRQMLSFGRGSERDFVDLDKVAMVLLPRILDENPGIFSDDEQCLRYSTNQVDTFISSLPQEAQGKLTVNHISKDQFRHQSAASLGMKGAFYKVNSPYQVSLGFLPDYHAILDCVEYVAPRFFLTFGPIERQPSRRIIELALNQFYLHENGFNGKLLAMGSKDEKLELMGLDCLANYLPKGTRIEGRNDEMIAHIPVKYKIS